MKFKKIGKSHEGQKFKSRISFWTLRPTEMGEGGYKADRKCGCVGLGVCVCEGG